MQNDRMRAELRDLDCIETDLDHFEGDAFHITVTATIGIVGEEGADYFTFDVCSPAWLQSELESEPVVSGQYMVIMAEFDFPVLKRFVDKKVSRTEGVDWHSIVQELKVWSRWEFDGMTLS